MGTHLVEPGDVLADRYVVEDLLAEEGESSSWRARDKILARSVVLQILPSASPQAADLLTAAKKASRIADSRLLQILDAVDDGDLVYVVREWATGQSLDVILAEGPLAADRAAWLVREVASVMSHAHRVGLPHRRLAPDTVVVTTSSGIKVVGLGTFAALRAAADDGAGKEQDTADLGRLLYACLTARWPGGAMTGLPAAPTEHGRLLRPRQVRAGVPRSLDGVCDRILSDSSRYGPQLTSVTEVKEALGQILTDEGVSTTGVGVNPAVPPDSVNRRPIDAPPALLPRDPGPPTGDQPYYVGPGPERAEPSSLGRSLLWTVLTVLIAGVILLAYLVGQRGGEAPAASTGTPSPGASSDLPLRPIRPISAVSFDPPPGSGDENPDLVPLAIDGNADTAWETVPYYNNPRLGLLKDGVGLVLDLGRTEQVGAIQLTMPIAGTELELRAAPPTATTAPQTSADEYPLVETLTKAATQNRVAFDAPVRTRFVLVWLTSLPAESSGAYRGLISEIQVLG